jgi:hypothetical protein
MKVVLFIVIFLLMNAFFIISNQNLALKNPDNVSKLFVDYGIWVMKVGNNIYNVGGEVTGNVVKFNWLPKD